MFKQIQTTDPGARFNQAAKIMSEIEALSGKRINVLIRYRISQKIKKMFDLMFPERAIVESLRIRDAKEALKFFSALQMYNHDKHTMPNWAKQILFEQPLFFMGDHIIELSSSNVMFGFVCFAQVPQLYLDRDNYVKRMLRSRVGRVSVLFDLWKRMLLLYADDLSEDPYLLTEKKIERVVKMYVAYILASASVPFYSDFFLDREIFNELDILACSCEFQEIFDQIGNVRFSEARETSFGNILLHVDNWCEQWRKYLEKDLEIYC